MLSSFKLSSRICHACNDILTNFSEIRKSFIENQRELRKEILLDDIIVKEEFDEARLDTKLEVNWQEGDAPQHHAASEDDFRKSTKRKSRRLKISNQRMVLSCDECDFKCKDKRAILNHKFKLHKGSPPPQKLWICEKCSKKCKSKEVFKRHQDKHNNVVRYSCGKLRSAE